MEININDYFKLDDSHSKIRGFVFGYNDKDELVFAKENMITKAGRRYIMEHGFSGTLITKAVIGTSSAITTADMATINALKTSESDILPETNSNKQSYAWYTTDGQKVENISGITPLLADNGESGSTSNHENIIKYYSKDPNDENDDPSGYYWYSADGTTKVDGQSEAISNITPLSADNGESGSTSDHEYIIKYYWDNCIKIQSTDSTNLQIYFEIVFSDSKIINTNCLGLFIGDILFSRLTFPTQYKSGSEKLTFKYYIYF